jgi:hypothetical protein
LHSAANGNRFGKEQLSIGIGWPCSGCGAAIIGTPDQVFAEQRTDEANAIAGFILSGYPLMQEAHLFTRKRLRHIPHRALVIEPRPTLAACASLSCGIHSLGSGGLGGGGLRHPGSDLG